MPSRMRRHERGSARSTYCQSFAGASLQDIDDTDDLHLRRSLAKPVLSLRTRKRPSGHRPHPLASPHVEILVRGDDSYCSDLALKLLECRRCDYMAAIT
jgi:hypothetical protein